MARDSRLNLTGGGSGGAAARARANSMAAAKAVAPKKPKGPVKVAKLVPAKKTSTGAIKINTNPKRVVKPVPVIK